MAILDSLHAYNLRYFPNLAVPVLKTPVVSGTPGATTYEYQATFTTINGDTTASATASIATGNATCDGTNRILLQVESVPAGVRYINFFRSTTGVFKYIGQCTAAVNALYDEGQAVTSVVPATTNTSGREDWRFIGYRTDRPLQRMELVDQQAMNTEAMAEFGSAYHKNGDIMEGCKPQHIFKVSGFCTATVVATGHATLSTTNRIKLVVDTIPAGVSSIRFYKLSSGTYQYLGWCKATVNEFYDVGQAFSTLPVDVVGGSVPVPDAITATVEGTPGTTSYTYKALFIETTSLLWSFSAGKIYLDGRHIPVPATSLTISGTGTEYAGIVVTTDVVDYTDDVKLRNIDDNIPAEMYNLPGADRIISLVEWSIETTLDTNLLVIAEFNDGAVLETRIPPEYSELYDMIDRRTYDVSGSFTVKNFPLSITDHDTDDTKLYLNIGSGKAYPNGHEVQIDTTQTCVINKARTVKAINGSGTDSFSADGGYVICTNPQNYAVDTLNIKLTVGSGNAHTVTLSGNGQTAAQLVTQIEAVMNAYATDGDLVECTAAGGYLKIQAIDGKTLTISAVATDAYTILGLSTGVNYPIGTRIYEVNDAYVKTVTDMVYRTEVVESVTHNAQTHIDALVSDTVVDIIGAADTAANCHDGKWDYEETSDFVKDGNSISFAGVQGSEPGSGATYYVKYAYNISAEKGIRELVRVTDAKVTKGADYTQDKFTFTDATFIKKVINDEAVVGLSGNSTDVVRILRVTTTPAQSVTYYTDYEFLKNSTALIHEDSEIDWSAAGAPNSGVTGQPIANAVYYVTYEFWNHSTEGDYVSADSYDIYEEIEMAPNETWYLRDCIDFRTEGIWPEVGQSTVFDYEYYLPRRDKVVLYPNSRFAIIEGTPSKYAPIPQDQPMVLSIGVVCVPPYTYDKGDVTILPVDSMRTTQYGIANLEDRIVRLEYWNAINALEKEAAGHPTAVDTKGLFTDALTGFNKMDLTFDKGGITYSAALDRHNKWLLLPATTDEQELIVAVAESNGIREVDNTIMLDYQPEVIQTQPYASITMNCASDFMYENYYGIMLLDPPVDSFIDKTQMPALNVEMDNNWASILAADPEMFNHINWGSWGVSGVSQETLITLYQAAPGVFGLGGYGQIAGTINVTTTETRQGVESSLVPGSRTMDLGNRIVDISIMGRARTTNADGSPFMIKVSITGLMPNIDHACTFGGVPVNLVYDATPVNKHGSAGSNTYKTKSTARTSNDGNLTATFQVPAGVQVGKIAVDVFYYASHDISSAQTIFYTSGFTASSQGTTVGYDVPILRQACVDDTRSVTTITPFNNTFDPLAQSFFVPAELTYVSAVGLYFQTKHATQGITVQIRNMINGYPGPYVYASKTLAPSEVSISANSSVETIFTFSNVLGYQANNEYCFVIMPSGNNTGYELFCEEIGQLDYITGARITTQPASGVMFHAANNTTWEAMSKKDIKYKLYRSNFEENCSIVFDGLTGLEASRFVTAVTEFIYPGTHVIWSYRVALTGDDFEDSWEAYNPNIDVDLEAVYDKVQLRIDVTSLGGNYQIISKVAGIVFMLHDVSANYVGRNSFFSDALEYPNKIAAFMEVYADGSNGEGVTSITPKYSVDDGVTFVEIGAKAGYIPEITTDPFYRYEFETPDEATVTGATNASVIEITSEEHGFKEGAVVDISGVTVNTNANGTFRIKNVTDDTFELTNPTTGVDIAGNGTYGTGGTITLTEFEQMRPLIYFETSNRARTPRVMNPAFICSRI
jgi:hypothetical protein